MIIKEKSPTRVDLSGGTLDLWPIYMLVPNSVTVNLAINIYTYCELKPREDKKIILDIHDLNYKKQFNSLDELNRCGDKELILIKTLLNHFKPEMGFEMQTRSESPVGGGLGGSSSLMITIIKAFSKWLNKNYSLIEKVMLAKDLEAQVLKTPTGMQDYIPAANPGLNIIQFLPGEIKIDKAEMDKKYFSDRMFLVDTGKAHHSGINNWQVYKALIDGHTDTFKALCEIRDVSLETKEVCLKGDFKQLPALFNKEYKARTRLAEAFSSPEIQRLEDLILHNSGLAVKICGAGGGGSVLVWCSPENKSKVMDVCLKSGFQVLKVEPVDQ